MKLVPLEKVLQIFYQSEHLFFWAEHFSKIRVGEIYVTRCVYFPSPLYLLNKSLCPYVKLEDAKKLWMNYENFVD